MSVFGPLFLFAGLLQPRKTALAGLVFTLSRLVGGLAYSYGGYKHPLKMFAGITYHLSEVYIIFLLGAEAYKFVNL